MKKLLAVMLSLAMLLTAAAFAEEADYLGIWYLTGMESEGETYLPSDWGMSMCIELNEDGTAKGETVFGSEAETEEGTWELNGDILTVTIGGDPADFTLDEEGRLIATQDGQTMIFGREPVEGEAYVPAESVAAEEADFEGSWTAFKYGADGVWVDAAVMGMDMVAEFEDGSLLLTGFLGSDTPIPMEFEDGAYIFATEDDSEMIAGIVAEMLEDGNLQIALSFGEEAVFLIMAPTAAEEEPAA